MKSQCLHPDQVLYEDNHLLVVHKPAGIATMGAEQDLMTVARMAQNYLKQKYNKPGNVYIGVVNRLDLLVTGVLVLARTSKAAGRLSDQIRRRTVEKKYLACVEGIWESPEEVELVDYVRKNDQRHRMEVVPNGNVEQQQVQEARLKARLLAVHPDHQFSSSLLRVELLTGRKHQIRLQLAERGFPVLGDWKYGDAKRSNGSSGIALHCESFTLTHPTKEDRLCFQCLPDWSQSFPQACKLLAMQDLKDGERT